MFLFDNQLEALILNILQGGFCTTKDLLFSLQQKRPGTTKQGMYKSLNKMKRCGVVVWAGFGVSLSALWVEKCLEFFLRAQSNYGLSLFGGLLGGGLASRSVFYFRNLKESGIFLDHIFKLLLQQPLIFNSPVLVYNPHNWFGLVSRDAEDVLLKCLARVGCGAYIILGGSTPLDKKVSREFLKYKNYDIELFASGKQLFPNNYYLCIFGDILLEFFVDKNIATMLEGFYLSRQDYSDSVYSEMSDMALVGGRNRVVLSYNPSRAKRLSKILKKPFIV